MHRMTPCNQVIELIEWFEQPDSYIIIMERPNPCQDLFDYITEKKYLDEHTARNFFWQVCLKYSSFCCFRYHLFSVFHRLFA